MLKIINWFCGATLAAGLAAAGVLDLRRYLTSTFPPPEQAVVAAILDYPTVVAAFVLPFLAGVLVMANYFLRESSPSESELGVLLAQAAITFELVGGFIFGLAPGTLTDVVAYCAIPLLTPLAAVGVLAAALYFSRYLPSRSRSWLEDSAAAAWPWLALAFLAGPGLWCYAFVVVGHGWSPGWSFLLLAAYIGALRVAVPIIVSLLFWPILTEQQMDP